MAIELIRSPNKPQTFKHDLESFYWVLIWIVVSYMKTEWTEVHRAEFLGDTMNPKIYIDDEGNERAEGNGKEAFLLSKAAGGPSFIPQNPVLSNLLRELKSLVSIQYKPTPSVDDIKFSVDLPTSVVGVSDAGISNTAISESEVSDLFTKYMVSCHEKQRSHMNNHSQMLSLLHDAFSSDALLKDDSAKFRPTLLPKSSRFNSSGRQSSSKRFRSEENNIFTEPSPSKRQAISDLSIE